MTPDVSVIIPVRNRATLLPRTLASVYAQTGPRLEVLLVDDHSTDGSVIAARAVSRPAHIELRVIEAQDRGANRARNQAFELARGAYIQWLDSDDCFAPAKLARQVAALRAAPGAAIAYGDWRWHLVSTPEYEHLLARGGRGYQSPNIAYGKPGFGRAEDTLARYVTLDWAIGGEPDFLRRLLQDRWLPPHAYLLTRAAAERLHELNAWWPDESLDREYFTIAALIGLPFVYVPGSVAWYYSGLDAQLSAGFDAAEAARRFGAIFPRLRRIAAEHGRGLTAEHRYLLNQSWQVWRVHPRLRVAPDERGRYHVQAGDAPAARVSELVARMLVLLRQLPPSAFERAAKSLAWRLPALWEDHTNTLRRLRAFADAGWLLPVAELGAGSA